MGNPAIRSNVERTFFGLLRELSPEQQAQLEHQANPEDYRAARDAPLLGWNALSHAVGLRSSIRTLLGDDARFVALMRNWAVLSTQRPPFKLLSEAIFRIYDRKPGALLRAYARVWTAIYRDVAYYEVALDERGHAQVLMRGTCPEGLTLTFRLYKLGIFEAVVELGGGSAVHGTQRVSGDTVAFDLHWSL